MSSELSVFALHIQGKRQAKGIREQLFRLRARVFYEKLGWDVFVDQRGREQDEFDTEDSHYCALLHNNTVVGTWRAIPTTKPYLLQAHFPHLIETGDTPCAADQWEISRFAVDFDLPTTTRNYLGQRLIKEMLAFGVSYDITRYVSVTSPALERFFQRSGIDTFRLGKCVDLGRTRTGSPNRAVAAGYAINTKNLDAVGLPVFDGPGHERSAA